MGLINGIIARNMKRYPILILAYRRTMELLQVLESLKQLNPSVVYFHIHNAPTEEEQKEVEEVKSLIKAYGDFPKKIKYSKVPLGVRDSLLVCLDWITEEEKQFYVFEDDIVLKPNSAKELDNYMSQLEKEDGVLKFGSDRKRPVYWGWATTAETAKRLVDKSVWDMPEELIAPYFQDIWHYKGIMEAFKRGNMIPWDDEFGIITKALNLNEILSDTDLTEHIGHVTTRDNKDLCKLSHVSFRNGVLVPQENENI